MSDVVETVDRVTTKLGVRPLAARTHRLWWDLRYKQQRLRSDTYRVTVGDARADFYVLTKREYFEFVRLRERPILEEILSELRPDDVFYDLGANLGLYSCLVADIVEPTVVAFEPHPRNADRLAQNVSLNESEISVQRIALDASSGSARIQLSPGFDPDDLGSAGHTLLAGYYDEESESIPVTKVSGDEFVATEELPPPTVLKIDVEGTEMDALKGFASTLARPECRLVYCEIHEDRLDAQGYSVSDISAFLESRGFSVDERYIEGYQRFIRGEKAEEK